MFRKAWPQLPCNVSGSQALRSMCHAGQAGGQRGGDPAVSWARLFRPRTKPDGRALLHTLNSCRNISVLCPTIMQYILAAITATILLILSHRYLRSYLARQRFIKGNNLAAAPNVDSVYKKPDFKTAYNTARDNGQSIAFLQDLLLPQPGRTAAVHVDKQTWLFTSNVDNMKTILATHADAMCVEPLRKGMLQGWVGDGMFGSDGERWKVSRNLFKPMFSRAPVSELRQWDMHTQQFFANLPNQGTTVDLQPLCKRLVSSPPRMDDDLSVEGLIMLQYFDASMETLFGQSANSQRPELATFDVDTFEANFEAVMTGSYLKFVAASPDAVDKDWQGKCDYIHDIFDQLIERALEERRTGKKSSNASMLHGLIDFSNDKQFLRDQLINVFLGAKDTAGIGISLIMFFLARNAKVYERLRDEAMAIGDKPLTFELLKSMKYLQNVMAECEYSYRQCQFPA